MEKSEHVRGFEVAPLAPESRRWAERLVREHWASPVVVTRGRAHYAPGLPGFVAITGGDWAGLVTYRIEGTECELVTLDSLAEGIGIGSALVESVRRAALERGCVRLWLITTNDNLRAVRFYQKRGFHIAAVHLDALEESRRLKPEIPLTGLDGIPLTDEIEMEMRL